MPTMQIAPQRTFPKQLPEFVKFFAIVFDASGYFETNAFFKRQFHLILLDLTEFQVRNLTAVREFQNQRVSFLV